MPRRLFCFLIALAMLTAGLLWRLAPLHLSAPLYKYGGSVLWAAMIYWLLAALLPTRRILHITLLAIFLATAIECFKLYRSPALDAFRFTLAGKLLLGRIFSYADVFAYLAAITSSALIDHAWIRRRPADRFTN